MLRAIYQDKYFAIQNPEQYDAKKKNMYVFISCFNIPPALCKTYQVGQYSVHVSSIKGSAKVYGSGDFDPLTYILQPLYALRASFKPDRPPFVKMLIFALCISAKLKLLKESNKRQLKVLYSKSIQYIPDIQSSVEQLVSFLIYNLQQTNSSLSSDKRQESNKIVWQGAGGPASRSE